MNPPYPSREHLKAELARVIRVRKEGDPESFTGLMAEDSLAYWLRQGLPAEQIVDLTIRRVRVPERASA